MNLCFYDFIPNEKSGGSFPAHPVNMRTEKAVWFRKNLIPEKNVISEKPCISEKRDPAENPQIP